MVSQVDGRNITTQFEYNDTDEMLTKVKFPNLSGQDVTMEYDSFDRLWKVTDPTGVVTSEFDDLGNILKSVRTYTGMPQKQFKYHFYPDGSRLQMETPAGAWNYAYDDGGLCTQMTSPAGTMKC
ncbi:MAG: hypothetical protein K1X67_22270 [Fimbriimonadaceae bacterium]|nr:hypothetical protein [Fimbriimonadaceae bacterium]